MRARACAPITVVRLCTAIRILTLFSTLRPSMLLGGLRCLRRSFVLWRVVRLCPAPDLPASSATSHARSDGHIFGAAIFIPQPHSPTPFRVGLCHTYPRMWGRCRGKRGSKTRNFNRYPRGWGEKKRGGAPNGTPRATLINKS